MTNLTVRIEKNVPSAFNPRRREAAVGLGTCGERMTTCAGERSTGGTFEESRDELDRFVHQYEPILTPVIGAFSEEDEIILRKFLWSFDKESFTDFVATRKYMVGFNKDPKTKVPDGYSYRYLTKSERTRVATQASEEFLKALKNFNQ